MAIIEKNSDLYTIVIDFEVKLESQQETAK